jgi:hypothetical protein
MYSLPRVRDRVGHSSLTGIVLLFIRYQSLSASRRVMNWYCSPLRVLPAPIRSQDWMPLRFVWLSSRVPLTQVQTSRTAYNGKHQNHYHPTYFWCSGRDGCDS